MLGATEHPDYTQELDNLENKTLPELDDCCFKTHLPVATLSTKWMPRIRLRRIVTAVILMSILSHVCISANVIFTMILHSK